MVAGVGTYRLLVPHPIPVAAAQVVASPAALARGEHLAYLCVGCHSANHQLPLAGGANFFASGGPPFGAIYPPNLTPSALKNWSDGQIIRAIREGVDNNGRALVIMPSQHLHAMSDEDVRSLVAYLRAQPAVPSTFPETQLNLLGAIAVGAGMFPTSVQPAITTVVTAPPIGPTPEYGRYAVTFSGCTECHGANLTGGNPAGFAPVGPNLRQIVGTWQQADFLRFFRTGVDPNGRRVDPEEMPWTEFGAAFTDPELTAIYAYIRSLPPT